MTKFLIIRFSSIGDIVLTSPVIRCLKQQFNGEAEIHFLTKESYRNLIQANPYISKIHTIKQSHKEVVENLIDENFDYIIDLHHNLRTLRVKKILKKPAYSFQKLNIEKWMLVNLKKDRLPNIHIVERYLKTIESFEIKNDNKGLDFFFPKDYQYDPNIYPTDRKFIAFVIGAKFNTKRLPTSEIEKICQQNEQPIVLLGGVEEKEEGEAIAKKFSNVQSLAGKCSLLDSAFIVQKSDLVVCHDTGFMHIASAFQKNIVSIWGNTTPKFGMYPFNIENNFTLHEVKDLKCRPCSKIGFQECPKKHFNCMSQQNIQEIQSSIEKFTSNS